MAIVSKSIVILAFEIKQMICVNNNQIYIQLNVQKFTNTQKQYSFYTLHFKRELSGWIILGKVTQPLIQYQKRESFMQVQNALSKISTL